jgi:hypothetical protein
MKNDYELSRREFVRNFAVGLAISTVGATSSCSQMSGVSQRPKLPMRTLGRTGLPVTILTYGGGSQFTAMDDGEKGMVATVDRKELERRLAPLAGPHALCWARPDYDDGMTTA